MKRIFAIAVIATMIAFSLTATATDITFDTLAKTGTHFQWVLYGVGILCFMKLRKNENAE